MEKLIVKNFGPIIEAEIDLTKYVVFIGDTSTGKSVLAKLIAIFRDGSLILTNDRYKKFIKLLADYNIYFIVDKTVIEYYSDEISIKFFEGMFDVNGVKKLENSNELVVSESNNHLIDILSYINNLDITDVEKEAGLKLARQIFDASGIIPSTVPVYFPAERILVSLVEDSISGLWANNVTLTQCFKDFAAKFELARKRIGWVHYSNFNLNYRFENGKNYVSNREEEFQLNQSSTGIQSLLPLLLVLNFELGHYDDIEFDIKKTFIVEEPELNLFPIKQKLLIEYIFESVERHNLIFTTHSPYILSVLDTLMLANNTYNEHPDLKEEIAAIVSEDKWIDYNDISVYEVLNNGTIRSIKNEEFKSIDTNAIDRVSDIISDEFDKLTELRYAQ